MPRDAPGSSGFTISDDEPPLSFVQPHKLQGVPVPPREWIVEDWLPAGAATLNYGDGGVGKTLLAQQLMTSCATGKPWCGLAVTRCRSLAIFCEDDEAEIHRRQDRINHACGVEFDDLDDMIWASCVGKDNALMRFLSDGRPALTELLSLIKNEAKMFQARLIVLDTAADLYGGDENNRAQVRNFISALNAWAMKTASAVLINAHPSRSGLSSNGDMDGGSTAWSNTARSRWSLTRPKSDDGDADADERVLTRRKSNYASIGDTIKLRWQNGVLVPIDRPSGLSAVALLRDAEDVFMVLLAKANEEGRPVSASRNSANFAPKLFAGRSDRQGFDRNAFNQAMERLFTAGKIRMEEYGRPGPSGKPRQIVAVEGGQGA